MAKTAEGEFSMEDFEVTPVAQDALRFDCYNDDIDGPTKGRYTEVLSVCQAMSLVILFIQAIEKCEVMKATSAGSAKKLKKSSKEKGNESTAVV